MKLLLFGGAGFIGTNIVREALSRGHGVVVFDNLERKGVDRNLSFFSSEKWLTFIKGDIRNEKDLGKIPTNIDCIINLAANPSVPRSIIDPLYDFQINVVGHLTVLEYARKNGNIPVILASSNKVYTDKLNTYQLVETATRYRFRDKRLVHGVDETADVDGWDGFTNSPYGVAKLTAEKYSREYWRHYGVPVVINRMGCVYGEFQKGVEEQGWVDWFLRAKRGGHTLTIYGDGKQVRDVLFGADVARLYIDEAEKMSTLSGATFNVGGGTRPGYHTSLLELIGLIDDMFPGKKLVLRYAPWRSSDQRVYLSDIRRVTRATGWKPTTRIKRGLRRMWEAYERYGE